MFPKFFFSIIFLLSVSFSARAQFDILNKVKEKVEEKAKEKTGEAIDKATEPKKEEEEKKEENDENTNAGSENNENVSEKKDELKTYSKFDFIPGEKVIFYEDFSQDNVGDFPALWNTNGSAEVVNTNLFPGNWLQYSMRNALWTDELLDLPDNYTIEYDVIPIKGEEGSMAGYGFRLMQSINAKSFDYGAVPGKAAFSFYVEYFGRPGYSTYINGNEGEGLGLSGSKDNNSLYEKQPL